MIKLTVKNFNAWVNKVNAEEQKILNSIVKANVQVSSEAVRTLKEGLNFRAGRKPSDSDYANSPKGAMPYGHTMALRDSIGLRVIRTGDKVFAEVGSGANRNEIEYAKYLEGYNHNGIRPFLWYIEDIFTASRIIEKFKKYYKAAK